MCEFVIAQNKKWVHLKNVKYFASIISINYRKVHFRRYYVVVDEREPPGDTNWTQLTDKVTASRLKIPYYVAGSFSTETLTEPTTFPIGDGTVVGGYLNYPLTKGKTYNYEIYTKWMMHGNQPVISRLRGLFYLNFSENL